MKLLSDGFPIKQVEVALAAFSKELFFEKIEDEFLGIVLIAQFKVDKIKGLWRAPAEEGIQKVTLFLELQDCQREKVDPSAFGDALIATQVPGHIAVWSNDEDLYRILKKRADKEELAVNNFIEAADKVSQSITQHNPTSSKSNQLVGDIAKAVSIAQRSHVDFREYVDEKLATYQPLLQKEASYSAVFTNILGESQTVKIRVGQKISEDFDPKIKIHFNSNQQISPGTISKRKVNINREPVPVSSSYTLDASETFIISGITVKSGSLSLTSEKGTVISSIKRVLAI